MRKILIYLGALLGVIILLFTIVAKQLVYGINTNAISKAIQYSSYFGARFDKETSIMVLLMKISQNSHWIITGVIIWLLILTSIWGWRSSYDNERKNKRK